VQNEERPQNHHRVPNAEHVGPRPAGGDGEDVAEKADVGAGDEVGVGELARANVQACGLKRGAGRRHHAAVGRDGDEVEKATDSHDPHEADVEVPHDARADEPVGDHVGHPVKGLVALRHDGDQDDLDREGRGGQPEAANLERFQATQPSSRHRDRDEQQEEGEGEGHSGGRGGRIN
jgi:hypothetical protein